MVNTLESVSFINFQSFKEERIELSPGLTAIVGPSNLGKSAVLRGIRALMRNAPAPGLIREGSKEFHLGASFSDGTVEQLDKGKNKSVFTLILPDDTEIVHAKAGASSVPDEVASLWNLPEPDGRDLCFASQHDKPFLLDEPASAVAKVLGELTNASTLMLAVQETNKRRTAALADEKARLREADEARAELLTHKGMSARAKALEAAEHSLETLKEADEAVVTMEHILESYDELTKQIDDANVTLSRTADVTYALNRATDAVYQVQELEILLTKVSAAEKLLAQSVEVINNATLAKSELETQIHDIMSEQGVCPLCNQAVV